MVMAKTDSTTCGPRCFPIRLPCVLWVVILLAVCAPRFSEPSRAGDDLPPDPEQQEQPPLPEPWRIAAEWRGSRGGGSETSAASDGKATWKSDSGRQKEVRIEAANRLRIAQHARSVIRRFQLGGHRVEDGVTSTWSISAGSATVELRDQGGNEVSIPVMDLWDFANGRGVARKKPDPPRGAGRDGPNETDRSLKSGGRRLLPPSAFENSFKVVVTLRGKGSALLASTISLDDSGAMVLSFRANRTFDLESGRVSVKLKTDDRDAVLDTVAHMVEDYRFTSPAAKRPEDRETPASAEISLLAPSDDCLFVLKESDLDNNVRLKAEIQKLLDAVTKYAHPEKPPRD
jgi:hypothetical protein